MNEAKKNELVKAFTAAAMGEGGPTITIHAGATIIIGDNVRLSLRVEPKPNRKSKPRNKRQL